MTTELPLCTYTTKVLEQDTREFAARDKKGRTFGGRYTIRELTLTAQPEGVHWGRRSKPGVQIEGTPHAMRGGKPYGASQDRKNFASMEEAHAARDKYFAAAEKRALNHKDRRD